MNLISKTFPVTEKEYEALNKKFGKLCYYASWQLDRKNLNNNHDYEIEDFQQELMISVLRAGSYYKRQCYIESCFDSIRSNTKNKAILKNLEKIFKLWLNRTKHGANRQLFGPPEEKILDRLARMAVPKKLRPRKDSDLIMDTKFDTYAKQILWNAQRSIGKKISKERPLRSGQVSLSDFDYLGGNNSIGI
jgi:hypothetical protein